MKLWFGLEWSSQSSIRSIDLINMFLKVENDFSHKLVGDSKLSISIIIICRQEMLKQRCRLSKAEMGLSFDIILNFQTLSYIHPDEQVSYIIKAIVSETRVVLNKYKLADFDKELFLEEFDKSLKNYSATIKPKQLI